MHMLAIAVQVTDYMTVVTNLLGAPLDSLWIYYCISTHQPVLQM
jgi:hypothetical protein